MWRSKERRETIEVLIGDKRKQREIKSSEMVYLHLDNDAGYFGI